MIHEISMRCVRARQAVFIPCAVTATALLLVLCLMSASANSAGRRTLEVARASRWVRLAAASAFDEAVANITSRSRDEGLPLPSSPQDERDLSKQLGFLSAAPYESTLTNAAFASEKVEAGPVTFTTGPWVVQSGGSPVKVCELGMVTLKVIVSVKRAGQKVRKSVTVQRYATAVPRPGSSPDEGVQIVVSPIDIYHAEELL